MDYRAAGASAYLGLGATWALGLTSSAAQLQANAESIPKTLLPITGVIPFRETIFLPQSMILLACISILSISISYFSSLNDERAVTAEDLGIDIEDQNAFHVEKPDRPADWLDYSPALTIVLSLLALTWVISEFSNKDPLTAISNLNSYNFIFLMLGMALNWRPKRFLLAVAKAVPTASGVLIQFPLYGSIASILTKATGADGQPLAHHLSHFFVSVSTTDTFPVIMSLYSSILGFFVPSGGGKWLIEAPYVMQVANELKVHLGWTVTIYNAAEALPNLINPFWMLSLLGVLGLKAREIIGYTFTQFLFHVPLVIFLLWFLARTLTYHAPIIP